MSPRPRTATDEDMLAGALRAITRLGPAKMRLRDIAMEVGVSPAALVQRFGSKRALLLALASEGPEGNRQLFDEIRKRYRTSYGRLLALADCMELLGRTPSEIANSLAFLQIDLTDREFHRFALASSTLVVDEIGALVTEGIRDGELAATNARRLARTVQATLNGSLLNWAIHREGTLRAWVRRDLRTVLAPYRLRPGKS
jgi:AcrR family transcriptional regulator